MTYKDVINDEISRYFNYELNFLCLGTLKDYIVRKKLDNFINTIVETKYEDLDTYEFKVKKDSIIKMTKADIKRKIYELMGNIYRSDNLASTPDEFLDFMLYV